MRQRGYCSQGHNEADGENRMDRINIKFPTRGGEGKMLVSTCESLSWFNPLLRREKILECQATGNMFKVFYIASTFTNVFALPRMECRTSHSLSTWLSLCLIIPSALRKVDWHSSYFASGSCNESHWGNINIKMKYPLTAQFYLPDSNEYICCLTQFNWTCSPLGCGYSWVIAEKYI